LPCWFQVAPKNSVGAGGMVFEPQHHLDVWTHGFMDRRRRQQADGYGTNARWQKLG
jgi:hypothetical protein